MNKVPMKLYTEKQLLDICKSVAEKACANSLDENWVKEECEYYGYTKIEIDMNTIHHDIENDHIKTITVVKA